MRLTEALSYIEQHDGNIGAVFILASGVADQISVLPCPAGLIQLCPFVKDSLADKFKDQEPIVTKYHQYHCYMSHFWEQQPRSNSNLTSPSEGLRSYLRRLNSSDREEVLLQMLLRVPCARSFLRKHHIDKGLIWEGRIEEIPVIISVPYMANTSVDFGNWPAGLQVSSYFPKETPLIQEAIIKGVKANIHVAEEEADSFFALWTDLQDKSALIKTTQTSAMILTASPMDMLIYIIEKSE